MTAKPVTTPAAARTTSHGRSFMGLLARSGIGESA